MRIALLPLCTLPLLAACATFPELGGLPEPESMRGTYPTLAPMDELLAQVPPVPPTDPGAAVEASGAALRTRAAALQAAD